MEQLLKTFKSLGIVSLTFAFILAISFSACDNAQNSDSDTSEEQTMEEAEHSHDDGESHSHEHPEGGEHPSEHPSDGEHPSEHPSADDAEESDTTATETEVMEEGGEN